MKAKIDRLTVTSVEMEIPEACPECRADLREAGALREDQLVQGAQYGRLTADGPDCDGDADTGIDVPFVTGYACAGCGHVLATSEGA